MDGAVVNIRIEVDPDKDDRLEAWAHRERRSKREHVAYIVDELLAAYEADPLVMHRLAISRTPAGPLSPRAIPA